MCGLVCIVVKCVYGVVNVFVEYVVYYVCVVVEVF